MDDFSHVSVLISVVFGLALRQILTGLGRLIQVRKRVRLYWPAVTWSVILIGIIVQGWWATFKLRSHESWEFVEFAMVLAQPALIYLLTALVLPDVDEQGEIDLKVNYFDQSGWFFATAMMIPLTSIANSALIFGTVQQEGDLIALLLFVLLGAAGLLFRSEIVHKIIAPLVALMFVGYVAVFFAELR
jgi:hypothetical protein